MLLLRPISWRLLTRLTSASSVSPMTRTPAPGLTSRPCPPSSSLFWELRPELGTGWILSSAKRQASQAIMRNKPSRGNITKYNYAHLHLPIFHTAYYHNARVRNWSSELHPPHHWGSLPPWWPGAGCGGGGCMSCPGALSRHYRTRGGPGGWAWDTRGPGPGPGARGQRRWTGRGWCWAEPDWKQIDNIFLANPWDKLLFFAYLVSTLSTGLENAMFLGSQSFDLKKYVKKSVIPSWLKLPNRIEAKIKFAQWIQFLANCQKSFCQKLT